MHIIGSITGYTPRYFHHVLGDAHIYMNHLDAIGEQMHRIPLNFPELIIKNKITNIDNIDENQIIDKGWSLGIEKYFPKVNPIADFPTPVPASIIQNFLSLSIKAFKPKSIASFCSFLISL